MPKSCDDFETENVKADLFNKDMTRLYSIWHKVVDPDVVCYLHNRDFNAAKRLQT